MPQAGPQMATVVRPAAARTRQGRLEVAMAVSRRCRAEDSWLLRREARSVDAVHLEPRIGGAPGSPAPRPGRPVAGMASEGEKDVK